MEIKGKIRKRNGEKPLYINDFLKSEKIFKKGVDK